MKYKELVKRVLELEKKVNSTNHMNKNVHKLKLFDKEMEETKDLSNAEYVKLGTWNELPIIWEIKEKANNKLLLVSKHILTTRRFNDETNDYGNSEINRWLNIDFFNIAFTKEEQELISETKGLGRVFLLSEEECERLYPTDESKIKTGLIDKNFAWSFWLRSPNSSGCLYAYYVDSCGYMYDRYVSYDDNGVVPALYIDLLKGE